PQEMEDLLNVRFIRVFVDINIEKDIGMSIFVFDQDIEEKFKT
ncbi:Na-translocating system protein MpsC family protein, partial [Neobacillus drentensis]